MDIPPSWVDRAAVALWRADGEDKPFPGPYHDQATAAFSSLSGELDHLTTDVATRQRAADADRLEAVAARRLERGVEDADVYSDAAAVVRAVPAVSATTT